MGSPVGRGGGAGPCFFQRGGFVQGPGTRLLMAGDALASKPTACWQRDFATTSQRPFRKRRVSEALFARWPVASGGGVWRSDARRPEAPCGLSRAACPVSEASLHTVHRPVPQATRSHRRLGRGLVSVAACSGSPSLCSGSQLTVPKAGFGHTQPSPGRKRALSTQRLLFLSVQNK